MKSNLDRLTSVLVLVAISFLTPITANAVGKSSLTVTYRESEDAVVQKWTLRCNPVGGTLLRPSSACRKLAKLTAPFEKPSPSEMCTQVYVSEEVAVVRGTWNGSRVHSRFTKSNGCEIRRWKDLNFLIQGKNTSS